MPRTLDDNFIKVSHDELKMKRVFLDIKIYYVII